MSSIRRRLARILRNGIRPRLALATGYRFGARRRVGDGRREASGLPRPASAASASLGLGWHATLQAGLIARWHRLNHGVNLLAAAPGLGGILPVDPFACDAMAMCGLRRKSARRCGAFFGLGHFRRCAGFVLDGGGF